MKLDRQLQLRLPAVLDDALRAAASKMGLDRAEYVRMLIALALNPKIVRALSRFARKIESLSHST